MNFSTIRWVDGEVEILDQTKLPAVENYLRLQDYHELVRAIKTLQVRGAPLIGIAAAYAIVLAARQCRNKVEFAVAINEIKSARPTAVNLSWAVERMLISYHAYAGSPDVEARLLDLALQIHDEDARMCERIGTNGMDLMPAVGTVLTHCNAGALATGGMGTALAAIYQAFRSGKKLGVFACETRPILQGARLTAWELSREGLDVTLITDNMAGALMAQRMIDCVIVGADRIAINFDVANKIGTYALAVLAQYHGIPFYVAAPTSTFDPRVASGVDIEIEQRGADEVTHLAGQRITPPGVRVANPAFDVTPNNLITAIITDREVIKCKRWGER
ncbi:MAG: S-methyl-5-thioribose-1-phosphate isomerase [candidate division Zixibacteria bacterium]|nr:S-methyl-5-thioribose-1-phosphate isomerase [candidate division Zixibacteria bacterium]